MLPFLRKNSMVWYLSSGRKWVGKEKIPLQTSGIHFISVIFLHDFIGKLNGCFILVFLYFLFVCVLIYSFSLRGGGFISLENLLYFARNFPVCYLFLLSPFKIWVVGEKKEEKTNLRLFRTFNGFFWHCEKIIVKFLISCITCVVVHVHWASKIIVFYSLLIWTGKILSSIILREHQAVFIPHFYLFFCSYLYHNHWLDFFCFLLMGDCLRKLFCCILLGSERM